MTHRHTITIYTRRGCHLCDNAIAVVQQAAGDRAEIELIDIDTAAGLVERYTIRVPVIVVDGVEIAEYHITPEQVEVALMR